MRQAHQLDAGETVVISAINPATLDPLLEKAGAVLDHKKANKAQMMKNRELQATGNSLSCVFQCLFVAIKCGLLRRYGTSSTIQNSV